MDRDFLVDLFSDFGAVTIRPMFSGFGISVDGVNFAMALRAGLYFRADDQTIPLPPKNGMAQSIILPDPIIETTVPSGTSEIAVVIRDLERRGGVGFPYRIVAEPIEPEFEIAANATEASVPRGSTAAVAVTVKRKGYTGPIAVTVVNPPAGLTVRPGTIAAGQTAGLLTLTASPDASFPAAPIKLVGRGQGTSGPIERVAAAPVIFAKQTNLPSTRISEAKWNFRPAVLRGATGNSRCELLGRLGRLPVVVVDRHYPHQGSEEPHRGNPAAGRQQNLRPTKLSTA